MKDFKFNSVVNFELQDAPMEFEEKSVPRRSESSLIKEVDAIHEMTTSNYTTYTAKELRKSSTSWLKPHPKPILTHHNSMNGEPIGRVIGAKFTNKSIAGIPAHRLTLEISDEEAKQKVLDGRYMTVSVGGSAEHAKCSICSQDWVEEGWCEHRPGEEYDGDQAHLILEDLNFKEVSFVNVPADEYAQLLEENIDEGFDPDQMYSKNDSVDTVGVQEFNNDNYKGGNSMKLEEKVTSLEEKLEVKEEKLEVLEEKLETFETKNTELEDKLSVKTEKIETLEEKKGLLEDEINELTEENNDLKEKQHRALAEKVVDMKIELGRLKEDSREKMVEEHADRTGDSLNDTLTDLERESEVKESDNKIGDKEDDLGIKNTDNDQVVEEDGEDDVISDYFKD